MITKTYPSLKKPNSVLAMVLPSPAQQPQHHTYPKQQGIVTEERPSDADIRRAQQFKITPAEFVRRDKIVRALFLDTPFRCGQVTFPVMQQAREEYGKVTIRGIYRSYHDFTTQEAMDWPDDDKPLIITVEPEKKAKNQELVLCNHHWLLKPISGIGSTC